MKLGRDEMLMARHMHKDVLAIFAQGADPGRGKIGHQGGGGFPSSKNFFFRPEDYSNKPNSEQWSRSMCYEVLLFLVPFCSQILDLESIL